MSMRDYGVNDYGMVLDEETGKTICNKIVEDYYGSGDSWQYLLYDEGICEYISEFTGEATYIDDNGTDNWRKHEYYSDDIICYVGLKIPRLFEKAYNNVDEIVDELRERLGEYLPDDYDYRDKIRHIVGTYYG